MWLFGFVLCCVFVLFSLCDVLVCVVVVLWFCVVVVCFMCGLLCVCCCIV